MKALIESLGYVKVAVPYFISGQGLSGGEGIVMDLELEKIIKKLKTFEGIFKDNLDFKNKELNKYFYELRQIEDEIISKS